MAEKERSPMTDNNAIIQMQSSSSSSDDSTLDVSDTPEDLRGNFRRQPFKWKKGRSPEKICVPSRRMVWFDENQEVKIDDDDIGENKIDGRLVQNLRMSAVHMNWTCCPLGTSTPTEYTGQGSFCFFPHPNDDGSTRTIVAFLTANHNICSEENKDTGRWEFCISGHDLQLESGHFARLTIPNTGWRCDHEYMTNNGYSLGVGKPTWVYGVDISLCPEIPSDGNSMDLLFELRENAVTNVVVPNSFQYEIGMKVAMIVFSVQGPDKAREKLVSNINDDDELDEILGKKGEALIFTGRIQHVGDKHIEYDMNSFGGCSGAAVVLVKKGHPYHGHVIAVHVGNKTGLRYNIGFKLAGAVL